MLERPEDLTHERLIWEYHNLLEDENVALLRQWYVTEERAIAGYIQAKRGMWGLPYHEVAYDEQIKKENMEAQGKG